VQPRASRDRVVGRHGDALRLQVSAPPLEGQANQAVADLLAAWLGIPRRTVSVLRGHGSRDKLIEIASEDPAALAARIERQAAEPSG
jgi:uncharacterized protein (TIGR00251 family)